MANLHSDDYNFRNKSWVEMYEEEHCEDNNDNDDCVRFVSYDTPIDNDSSQRKLDNWVIRGRNERRDDDEDYLQPAADDESRMSAAQFPPKVNNTPPRGFTSYANILKRTSPDVSPNKNNSIGEINNFNQSDRIGARREIQKDFLNDDISLTSHLDVFHMQSPCKSKVDSHLSRTDDSAVDSWNKNIDTDFPKINEWQSTSARKQSPFTSFQHGYNGERSDEREVRGGKRRLPLMQVDARQPSVQENIDKIPDEILMPSPSKIIRNSSESMQSPKNSFIESRKRQRENYLSPATRQKDNFSSPSTRQRDSFSSPSTRQRDSFASPSTRQKDNSLSSPSSRQGDVEFETDASILARRQKQIDYGKNTVGYERYAFEVPRNLREKKHPKTPPRHIKFSRRAWDGLVKNWRRRLHYWDPPSQGGGNPELLEDLNDSELSDYSGCDSFSQPNSLPSTPQQDWKRRKAQGYDSPNVPYTGQDREYSDYCDDDASGCRPLDEV